MKLEICAQLKIKWCSKKLQGRCLPFIHKKRLQGIEACCEALIKGNTLSLTHLGRNITSKVKEGSNIERVNRLLGNHHLQKGKASDFQTHSSSFKNVLSIVYLGKQALKKKIRMTKREFFRIINFMKKLASSHPEPAF